MGTGAGELFAKIDAGVLGRTLLDAARAAHIGVTVTLVDTTPGPRNVYVSEAAAQLLGWPVEDVLDRDPFHHIASRDLARIRELFERRAGGEQGQLSYELLALRKDGNEVPLEVTTSFVTVEGRPAVVAFLVDVSARKHAEEQSRRNEARFRELIESAPEPISIIREGHFVYVNRAYLAALGYPDLPTLYAVPLSSLLDADEAAIREARESNIVEHRMPPPPYTYRVRRFDGSTVLLEVSSVYFEYDGKSAVLGMARDVTARRQLERQLVQADRLAALGTMAAGVAHEVNNPLAYLMLNLEWIARKLPTLERDPGALAGLMAMLSEAREGAQRVSTIVRELRSFSRADGETRRGVDLPEIVRSAIKIAGHEIRHKARIVTAFEPARLVWANESRLEQVVINLLLNAAQAMPETRVERNEIRIVVREDGDGRAVLEVFDNGEGIARDVLPRIFDPFFTTKPLGVGTGLGLSICHGIVTSLGGQIGAYSEPGEGTTFRVVLPTTDTVVGGEAATANAVASPRPAPRRARRARRARVLVIDDEPPIANTLRELLTPDHHVTTAHSGPEALAAVEQGDFDVVFCDLMIPGAGGVDLYEQLRSRRPGLERRMVFMTGGAFTSRTVAFLASIENRRVEKPFSLALIERIVREMAEASAKAGSRDPVLNIDLGELDGEPEVLYQHAHVAHVACGGHAGDEGTMRRAVALCLRHGTLLGAHPSYPDREAFGRRRVSMEAGELRARVSEQCARLARVAGEAGARVGSLKAHGALYHAASDDRDVAAALVDGALDALGPGITFVGQAAGELRAAVTRAGAAFLREGFADRGTREDGTLVPRGEPGALILEPSEAASRAQRLAASGEVDTIGVHGDTPGAVAIARAVREALDAQTDADAGRGNESASERAHERATES